MAEYEDNIMQDDITEAPAAESASSSASAEGAYVQIMGGYLDGMSVQGGGGVAVGGLKHGGITEAKDLVDYSETIYAVSKDKMVDDIAEALRSLGLKVEGKSRSELISSMLKSIPNTRTNKKTFKADARVHKDVCTKIAEALNSKFGQKLINPSADPVQVCQSVAELIYSLNTGMHNEFLAVHGDLRRIVRNLYVLKNSLSDNMERIEKGLSTAGEKTRLKLARELAYYKDVSTEVERQLQLLQNVLSIEFDPAEAQLERLAKQSDAMEILGLIEPIKTNDITRPGTKEFSRVMSRVLEGVALTPAYAEVINGALKRAGMTMREYAGMERLSELMDRLSSELAKDQSDESLHGLVAAVELLVKNFYRNKDIADVLSKSGSYSGAGNMSGAMSGGNIAGGDIGKGFSDRIKDKKTVRDALFYSFSKSTNAAFDRILASVEVLAKKMGTADVPMTDQLDGFRDAFEQLSDIRRRRVYFALTGYYNDAISKEMRERYMSKLRLVLSYAETLAEMSAYSKVAGQFKDIKGSVDALIKTIDDYADRIGTKFGSAEAAAADAVSVSGGAKLSDTLAKGMDAHKSTLTIQRAVKQFDYYFRVAQIRRNLHDASQDMDKYGADYKELLASAIGSQIQSVVDTYNTMLKDLDDKAKNPYLNYSGDGTELVEGADHAADKRIALKKSIKEHLEYQRDAKVKFWETVEAADHYLKEFTNGLMKHPEDIQDIKNTLDGVNVISNWYDNRSGNELALLFDMFPGEVHAATSNDRVANHPLLAQVKGNMDKHYYENVEAVNVTGANGEDVLPGNPYLVEVPSSAKELRSQATKVITNMALLKNLMSVFVTIGDRLGGENIHKKVFMTPTQMYENLCNYIIASSFGNGEVNTINLNLKTMVAPAATPTAGQSHVLLAGGGAYDVTNNAGHAVIRVGVLPPSSAAPGDITFKGVNATHTFTTASTNIQASHLTGELKGSLANITDLNTAPTRQSAYQAMLRDWGIYMRGIPTTEGNILDAFNAGFKEEDAMFVNLMKAMSAKVLTVLGTYDLMERPNEKQLINPVRMILGGAHETPEILEGAVELYVRLPLLAEFYRELFDFKGEKSTYGANVNDDSVKITMLPEIEGKFAQVVRLLFRRFAHIKRQQYTDAELGELISEINSLYNSYRGSADATHQIIRDFMNEVNKRYGFMKWKDHVSYLKNLQAHDTYGRMSDDRFRAYEETTDNYAILPGEEDIEGERIAPSSAYVTRKTSFDERSSEATKRSLADQHKLLRDFRCEVDKYFTNGMTESVCADDAEDEDVDYNDPGQARGASFRFAVKRAQLQLAAIKDKKERYDIASRLMRGYEAISSADHIKNVIFHETVVVGLNTLSAIYAILERFQRWTLLHDVDAIEKVLDAVFRNDANALLALGLGNRLKSATMKRDYVRDKIKKYLKSLYEHRFGDEDTIYTSAADELIRADSALPERNGVPAGIEVGAVDADGNGDWGNTTANHILGVLQKNANADEIKHSVATAKRYVVQRDGIMKMLLEVLFGFTGDMQGLVNVDVGDSIQIDFTGVRDVAERLLSDVKHFIEKLRPFIPAETMYEYERKENPGSVYWLEEHLMEKMFIGREPMDAKTVEDSRDLKKGYVSLADTARVFNNTYQRLICSWDVDGTELKNDGTTTFKHPADAKYKYEHYDEEVSQIAYYGRSAVGEVKTFFEGTILNNRNAALKINGSVLAYALRPLPDGKFSLDANIKDFNKDLHNYGLYNASKIQFPDSGSATNSILFAFNRILENYMASFVDRVSAKIYRGVLENLANGVLNGSVANPIGKGFPDDTNLWADPKETHIVFVSLALVMKNLMGDKDKTEKKLRYVEDSLSEVSLYMKEKYRAHMPIYRTYLQELIRKAELLRKLIQQKSGNNFKMSLRRDRAVNNPNGDRTVQIAIDVELNDHISRVLAAIVEASRGLISCIDQVLRELGDEPRYMETRMNALADYKAQYGFNAITPVSNLLTAFNGGADVIQLTETQGSKFKFQYGVRALLARPDVSVEPAAIPNVNVLYDLYNVVLSPKEQLDMSHVRDFNSRVICASRWVHETKNIKCMLSVIANEPQCMGLVDMKHDDYTIYGTQPVPQNPGVAGWSWNTKLRLVTTISTADNNKLKAAYSIKKDVGELVDLTENSLRKSMIEALGAYIRTGGKKRDLVMQNIIDMNVVPINVHSFMREVPLANILNYSYTFERMIVELFYAFQEPDIRNAMLTSLCGDKNIVIGDAKDLFVALLIDPYMNLHNYETNMTALMDGLVDMDLERPKYLSDQVWSKALFREQFTAKGEVKVPPAAVQVAAADDATELAYFDEPSDNGTRSRNAYVTPKRADVSLVKDLLAPTGTLRMNTILVRNLMFLVNLYRVIRLKLRKDLMYDRNIILKSNPVAREESTEFRAVSKGRWAKSDIPPDARPSNVSHHQSS